MKLIGHPLSRRGVVRRVWQFTLVAALTHVVVQPAAGQATVKSSDAAAFLGTWVFEMTNPAGSQETVRISDTGGVLSASVQAGRFPPINVSTLLKDGDMLVLTATRFENGRPIRAVISLIPDGDAMKIAQMLEFSETIKRGTGKKQ